MLQAIMAGVGAGTSLLSGWLQSRAANKAAEIQAKAAQGIADKTGQIATEYGGYISGAGEGVAGQVENAGNNAVAGVNQSVIDANGVLRGVYDTAGQLTDPYRQAGTMALSDLANLGNEKFVFNEDDPSYQWRVQEGQKALERSAAARGTAVGGGAMKAMERYRQGLASTEYQAAFDRFQASQANRRATLGTLVGAGQTATGQMLNAGAQYGSQVSDNTMQGGVVNAGIMTDTAKTAGGYRYSAARDVADLMMRGQQISADALTGAANAKAAGAVGSANAWSDGISGAVKGITDYITLRKMTQKPNNTVVV